MAVLLVLVCALAAVGVSLGWSWLLWAGWEWVTPLTWHVPNFWEFYVILFIIGATSRLIGGGFKAVVDRSD